MLRAVADAQSFRPVVEVRTRSNAEPGCSAVSRPAGTIGHDKPLSRSAWV